MALPKFLRPKEEGEDKYENEIKSIVSEGTDTGELEETEARMIERVFELDDKEAHDIMTHREEMNAIEDDTLLSDCIDIILDGSNSRYPVYHETIDDIVGIVHLKDVVRAGRDKALLDKPIGETDGLIKPADFVPETRKIDELFAMMQAKKTHLVIVVDEYGQTSGLVTLEDILEELVGDILDEYDDDEADIRKIGGEAYIVKGLTPLSDIEEKIGIHFEDDEVETLNGFLTSVLGHVPKSGEIFETDYGGYNFHVVSISNHVIQMVRIKKTIKGES
ncbi:MAG: HlyC/CorC family transporter [Lachnospiraceae bacterium]|nr:HlyC/CorC family transporter [Lachnospiraceae bacterium]